MSDFNRQESKKRIEVPSSWKKPRGKHSNARLKKKSAAPMPSAGYRTDKAVRGLHPSGYKEVLVHNTSDVEDLEEDEAAKIASKVGKKKRKDMLETAEENDVKVLNGGEN